jgi:epoxyqueuosine reductase
MTSLNPQPIRELLEAECRSSGFLHFGFAKLERPLSLDFYKEWLEADHHGSMKYLARHLPQKEKPETLLAKAQSAIVVAAPYRHGDPEHLPMRGLRIANYAQGEDYHFWLKEKLEVLIGRLKLLLPHESFLAATDSSPILERDLAYRAGLGWFGKNTCLIDQQRGSFFLLGEILTTAVLPTASIPHPDRCGTCSRCIDACPTQAIIAPKVLDARRCISYLTIEAKENPPLELRAGIGDHFFGCDICQTVCPWNRHAIELKNEPDSESLVSDLRFVLTSSKSELERVTKSTPLSRARGRGLKRNAIVVVANLKLKEFKPILETYVADSGSAKDPQLAELAAWAIMELTAQL